MVVNLTTGSELEHHLQRNIPSSCVHRRSCDGESDYTENPRPDDMEKSFSSFIGMSL